MKLKDIEKKIWKKLEEVIDPEIGIDVVNLGLIYEVNVLSKEKAVVKMTLTTPYCPMPGLILEEIKEKLSEIEDVENIEVEIVMDPPWSVDRMSKKAKRILGIK